MAMATQYNPLCHKTKQKHLLKYWIRKMSFSSTSHTTFTIWLQYLKTVKKRILRAVMVTKTYFLLNRLKQSTITEYSYIQYVQ